MPLSQQEEWLSLVDSSGPFLSASVLKRVFPHGLDLVQSQLRKELRSSYEEWNEGIDKDDKRFHIAWIDWVLQELLEFPSEVLKRNEDVPEHLVLEVPEHQSRFVPDAVITPLDSGKARLLISILDPDQSIDVPPADSKWNADPVERMTLACRELDVRLGLVTNGEQWVLVNAPAGENEGVTIWTSQFWVEEPLTLRAFVSVLGVRRFFSAADADTVEAMLDESIEYQEEVTDRLGEQVQGAVEVLVQALDRADADLGRHLLEDVDEQQLYEAAVTIMMRLVFLFNAEERGLLPLGDEFYDETFAVSPLLGVLRAEADRIGEEVLERREDAWSRLMAVSRSVYGGIEHDRLSLSGYGGSLFDPDRYAFLEGRPIDSSWRDEVAEPPRIDNRTVLHLLESLQLLKGRSGESRRLSFRALDVEQIGHVYEGLLDRTAVRVPEPYLGLLASKGSSAEVSLVEIENQAEQGDGEVVDLIAERTGRSKPAIRRGLGLSISDIERVRLRAACGNDDPLLSRVERYAALLREDSRGYPAVFPEGSLIVTAGLDRRSTQTYYTPRSLTEEVVQYALEPIVFEGPAEGKSRDEWKLKSPSELLDLKICDPTMGSGAFLVQVIRWLSERLTESWGQADASNGLVGIYGDSIDAGSTTEPLPNSIDERIALARRLIAERCIYGVDINPFAVEMAKMSIWLITMARDKPFGFLDHALKSGDSLLGIHDLQQISDFHIDPARGRKLHSNLANFTLGILPRLNKALSYRDDLRSFNVTDVGDVEMKEEYGCLSDGEVSELKVLGDAIVAAVISAEGNNSLINSQLVKFSAFVPGVIDSDKTAVNHLISESHRLLIKTRPQSRPSAQTFHWPLEFPEVFVRERSGFDAIVVNPPFLGGKRISGLLGSQYRNYLMKIIAGGTKGSADLAAYFLNRFVALSRTEGTIGLITTNSISQGDTQRVGLMNVLLYPPVLYRVIPSRPWSGTAALHVSLLWIFNGTWNSKACIDREYVDQIGTDLRALVGSERQPKRLAANRRLGFYGFVPLGRGFVMDKAEATDYWRSGEDGADVLRPLLTGAELSRTIDHKGDRFIIDFRDWSLEEASKYPLLLDRVERKVKPIRDKSKRASYKKYWWRFAERAVELSKILALHDEVLVKSMTSGTWAWVFASADQVFEYSLVMVPTSSRAVFAILQSFIHREWMWKYSSTLETRDRYTLTTCLATFPFPETRDHLHVIGSKYYSLRDSVCINRSIGLTALQNLIDDPSEKASEVTKLRNLIAELDQAVAGAYGWTNFAARYEFREVRGKTRYCMDVPSATEILERLLELNHSRYAEEQDREKSPIQSELRDV